LIVAGPPALARGLQRNFRMNVPCRAKEKAVADTGKIREHMEVIVGL
jgi:hypothetical protein